MINKFISILLLYTALAIMLGHSFIPHHHHFDPNDTSHTHHDHNGIPHNHDTEGESSDWGQFFANFHHGVCGLIFFTSHSSSSTIKSTPSAKLLSTSILLDHLVINVKQSIPPCISAFYNSHHYLPYGLRAPPSVIV